jgi:hypothetical protein
MIWFNGFSGTMSVGPGSKAPPLMTVIPACPEKDKQ